MNSTSVFDENGGSLELLMKIVSISFLVISIINYLCFLYTHYMKKDIFDLLIKTSWFLSAILLLCNVYNYIYKIVNLYKILIKNYD